MCCYDEMMQLFVLRLDFSCYEINAKMLMFYLLNTCFASFEYLETANNMLGFGYLSNIILCNEVYN